MIDDTERAERARVRELLESDLRRFAPGLEVVDRGLLLSRGPARNANGRRADLVLVDGAGAPLLALVVDGRREETVQAAVDALVFARENAGALGRSRGARARVALVAEDFSERCLEALALLPPDELWILQAKRFESEVGVRHVLVSVTPPPDARGAPEPAAREREAFLARVPEPVRDAAASLLRRLARLDHGARPSFTGEGVSVLAGERLICRLEVQDGRLEAESARTDGPRPIESAPDAEAFLDQVLRAELSGPREAAPDGPLLTPEEIAAFRE